MARTSASVVLLDATVTAASSGTKGQPGAVTPDGSYNNQANYSSPLGIIITNGALAPGAPLTVIIQVSDTGLPDSWSDYDSLTGDTAVYNVATQAGVTTKTILLEKVRFVRAIAFGNTAQSVDVKVRLHAVTGL